MKFFKKIFVPLLAVICAFAICLSFAACGDGDDDIRSKYAAEDDDTNWDYITYIVYLEMPDGSPAANVNIQVCSGLNCLPKQTNEDGRAVATFPSSQEGQQVYMHFDNLYDSNYDVIGYKIPDGCALPANSSDFDGTTVWYLTSKVSTFTFLNA